MVFMGNTQKSVPYMLKHSHFFEPLPDKYIDSAFLNRIHAVNPGREVAPTHRNDTAHPHSLPL
jgi:ATP-dependent Lon protease